MTFFLVVRHCFLCALHIASPDLKYYQCSYSIVGILNSNTGPQLWASLIPIQVLPNALHCPGIMVPRYTFVWGCVHILVQVFRIQIKLHFIVWSFHYYVFDVTCVISICKYESVIRHFQDSLNLSFFWYMVFFILHLSIKISKLNLIFDFLLFCHMF
jgi:hypothetical protein